MARLAWLLLAIAIVLVGGCAPGATSPPETSADPPRARERPPEAGGGGY